MANSKIKQTLAAAFPVREVKQPQARELTAPDVYAFANVPAPSNSTGGGAGASSLTQVLQATLKETSSAVTEADKQLAALLPVQQRNLDTVNQNTQALVNNTASKSGGGNSALSTVGNLASGIWGGGSILTPIVSGLLNLFRGPSTPQPTFSNFTMPAPVHLDTTLSSGSPQQTSASPQAASSSSSGGSTSVSLPPIQIQVSAMDSQSFLDHSDQIAQAVRQALLNSHPLADVIAEIT